MMKDYSRVRFIRICDNNNPQHFYIDTTIMKDPRLRMSAIKGQYIKYLESGELYRPVYDLLDKDYSFSCLEIGNFNNLEEVKKRRNAIIEEQKLRLKDSQPRTPKNIIKFN